MSKPKTKVFLKIIVFTMLLCTLFAFKISGAVNNRVYLMDGGTGDGSSDKEAVGSFRTAVKKLKDTGGEIIICGKYTVDELINLSPQSGTSNGNKVITVKSTDGNIDYRKTNNAMLCFGNGKESANMILAGRFVFEDINIVTNGGSLPRAIICGGYETVFGEGIVCKRQGDAPYISIVGVTLGETDVRNGSGMLLIKSGTYYDVCAGNRDNGVKGFTTLIINGGTFEGTVSATSIYGNTEQQGGSELTVNGGVFYGNVGAVGGAEGFIFNLNGGNFKKNIYAMGRHNVIDVNGGDLHSVGLIKIADVIEAPKETDEDGETLKETDVETRFSVVNVNSYDWDVDLLVSKIEGRGVIINKNTEGGQGSETIPIASESAGESNTETAEQSTPESKPLNEDQKNEKKFILGSKTNTFAAIAGLMAVIAIAVVILSYRAVYRKK